VSLLDELRELVLVPGVSGYEERVREFIKGRVERIVDAGCVRVDSIGNLIVEIGCRDEAARRIALIAHMDELGLVVTKIESDGRVAFRKLGGIDDRVLVGTYWEILTERGVVNGVVGLRPPHLALGEQPKIVPWHELRIDVGTSSREETEALGVKVLDPIVFKKSFVELANGVVSARALDDRFGCIVLLKVLERVAGLDLPCKLLFVWSVQEEIGLRGARVIANTLRPDVVFAVDSFPCCSALTGDVRLGGGPVLRVIDRSSISSPDLVKFVMRVADEAGLPLQWGVTGGGNDGSVIQNVGAKLAVIGVPMKYSHSLVECISLRDLEGLIDVLHRVVERAGELP